MKDRRGFTLLEILAVMVIIVLLVMLAIPAVTRYLGDSRQRIFAENASRAVDAVKDYELSDEYQSNSKIKVDRECSNGICYYTIDNINKLLDKKLDKSSFGPLYDKEKSRVATGDTEIDGVTKHVYSICLIDKDNNGLSYTYIDEISADKVKVSEVTDCGNPFEASSSTTDEYTVNVSVENGSVDTSSKKVERGNSVTFNLTHSSSVSFSKVTCTNGQVGVVDNDSNKLTVDNVTSNTSCNVIYSVSAPTVKQYSVSVMANYGSVSGDSTKTVGSGSNTTFTVNPNAGYGEGTVSCTNGQTATLSGTTLTTGSISSDTICTVTYKIQGTVLTADANGGAIPTTTGWSGSGDSATKTVRYGESYGSLPTPSKSGAVFEGWYTAANGGAKVTSSTAMGETSTTIYAHWSTDFYTVSVSVNNGSVTDNISKKVNHGSSTTFTLNPDTGYGNGKVVCTNDQTASISGNTLTTGPISEDTTCVVTYEKISVTLTANANGGEIPTTTGWSGSGDTATKDLKYNDEYEGLPVPTRDNYIFEGWFTDATAGSQVFEYTTIGASNVTIYAHWKVKTYSVSVTVNNGTITGDSVKTVNDGSSTTFTVNSLNGYADGSVVCTNSQTASLSGNTLTTGNITSDTVCTVTFKIDIMTLTANPNSGTLSETTGWNISNNVANKAVIVGNAYGILPNVSKDGYVFDGWYTSINGGEKVTSGTIMGTENNTIYAHWAIKTYTVSVEVNNGTISGADSKTVNHESSTTFTVNPKKDYGNGEVTCTNGQTASLSGNTLTTGNITQDTKCTITYHLSISDKELNIDPKTNPEISLPEELDIEGDYTYTKKSEKNSKDENTNYVTITPDGDLSVDPNIPEETYTVVATITDNETGESKDITLTIEIVYSEFDVKVVVVNGTIGGDGASSKTVPRNTKATFTLTPNSNYGNGQVSCTNSQTASLSGNTLTTGNITKDTTCTVTYYFNITDKDIHVDPKTNPEINLVDELGIEDASKYTFTKKSEKNSQNEDTNYVTITSTGGLSVDPNIPEETYTVVVTITDNETGESHDITLTIEIVYSEFDVNVVVVNGTIGGDGASSKTVPRNTQATFTVNHNPNYAAGEVTCTNGQTAHLVDNTLTTDNITKDTTCTVTYYFNITDKDIHVDPKTNPEINLVDELGIEDASKYTFTKKSEKNSQNEDTNYVTITSTGNLSVDPNIPEETYTVVVTITDNETGESHDITLTIEIVYSGFDVNLVVNNGTITGNASKFIAKNQSTTFTVTPSLGYTAVGVTPVCTNGQTATFSGDTLTTGVITNNTTCTITFIRITASDIYFDNSTSGVNCNNVQCMIDNVAGRLS